jgi:predicted nucleic acid-binding protein
VVTLAELGLGVQVARDQRQRAARMATLQAVERTYAPLPIDEPVAEAFARLVAAARRAGRRPKVLDCWIAATAVAHGVPVYTQDADFDGLAVDVVRV